MKLNPTEPAVVEQLINYAVINEVLKDSKDWASRAAKLLQSSGIKRIPRYPYSPITPNYLKTVETAIGKGTREPNLPAYFSGEPGPRYWKDVAYARFWTLAEIYFTKWSPIYCGLAANQIGKIASRLPNSHIYIIEKDKKVADWQRAYRSRFLKHSHAEVYILEGDIFEILNGNINLHESGVDILDLDLMCNLCDKGRLRKWVEAIDKVVNKQTILNLTTSVGHGITIKKYEQLILEELYRLFIEFGLKPEVHLREAYRDRVIPMRCEFFKLTRQEK